MNTSDYKNEVLRQLNNRTYYEKVNSDPSELIKQNIYEHINEMKSSNSHVTDQFRHIPSEDSNTSFLRFTKNSQTTGQEFTVAIPRQTYRVCVQFIHRKYL